MPEPTWTPANDTERAMAGALRDGDTTAYFRALTRATLYLPGFSEPGPPKVVTVSSGEETYLVAFTSPESLTTSLTGVEGYRTVAFADLAEGWPDPAWRLAVDPDLPIQGYMPIGVPARGAAGEVEATPVYPGDLDELVPVNDTERAIVAALDAGDVEELIGALVMGEMQVPLQPDGQWLRWPSPEPTIAVFTAPERVPEGLRSRPVPLLDLVLDWPGPDVGLMVAPGTSIEFNFPGEHVLGFVGWADELVNGPGASAPDLSVETVVSPVPAPVPSPEPASPTPVSASPEPWPEPVSPEPGAVMLQRLVPRHAVDWYLRGHGQLVSGPACRYEDIRHLRTPAELHAALGPGQPVGPDDGEVHAVRWLAPCPDLHPPAAGRGEVTLLRSHGVVLPHGAQIYRYDETGRVTHVASYDADAESWVRAPGTGLIGAALRS